jgi:hypothetical protein
MTDTKQATHRTNGSRSNGRLTAVEAAGPEQWLGSNDDPDVMLSVPELSVDKISLQVKELRADVDLQARVLDILDLRVGARVTLGEVDLDIENISAKAMLKVRLDKVTEAIDKVMDAITANPELLTNALSLNLATASTAPAPAEVRTVRGPALGRLLSGVRGAHGAEPQVEAVETATQVEHPPKKRAAKKRAAKTSTARASTAKKRAPRKIAVPHRRHSRK